jgi:hypothetical protein
MLAFVFFRMNLQHYTLTAEEKDRLRRGILAAFLNPLIDSIEDFIWEGIFCYAKQVAMVDPFDNIRTKKLFDVVDIPKKIGWSAKALQKNITPGCDFELVIQRADIFKKQNALGYNGLTRESPTATLGEALLKHWHQKIENDASEQNVTDKRICILLKQRNNRKFAYVEESLMEYEPKDLKWEWSDDTKTGLKGIRKADDFVVYKWYPGQTQFFERFKLHKDTYIFDLQPKRLSMDDVIELLAVHL